MFVSVPPFGTSENISLPDSLCVFNMLGTVAGNNGNNPGGVQESIQNTMEEKHIRPHCSETAKTFSNTSPAHGKLKPFDVRKSSKEKHV